MSITLPRGARVEVTCGGIYETTPEIVPKRYRVDVTLTVENRTHVGQVLFQEALTATGHRGFAMNGETLEDYVSPSLLNSLSIYTTETLGHLVEIVHDYTVKVLNAHLSEGKLAH